jgi:hypothetical protein
MSLAHWTIDPGFGLGVIRLGATREEIARALASINIELDTDDEDDWLYVPEMDTELNFKATKPPVLLEIVVEDEQVRFGPLPLIGERLHKVVDLLQVPDAETVWRTHLEADEERTSDERPIMTDTALLDRGTLWIPALGLGLGMLGGEICTVRIRKPEESPRRGYGTLTPAQRELSASKNLSSLLIRPATETSKWQGRLQKVLGFGTAIAMMLVIFQAIEYQGRWNIATVVQGNVIDVQPPPPDPFPDEYTIDYSDPVGKQFQVVFKRRDVYVAPQVGETIEVRFLPDAPHRPLGPARYRDVAFEKYVPVGIGVMATYCVLMILLPLAGWAWQKANSGQLAPRVDKTGLDRQASLSD